MSKGKPVSPEEKEWAIALASTSMTQEQIAAKVGISRRSLVRIWSEVGISRGALKGKRVIDNPIITKGDRGDAALKHQSALFDLAVDLRDSAEYPEPQATVELYNGVWWAAEQWRYLTEGDPELNPLFPYLKVHLSCDSLWESIEEFGIEKTGYVSKVTSAATAISEQISRFAAEVGPFSLEPWVESALVNSLLAEAFQRERGSHLDFGYEVSTREDSEGLHKTLRVGAWTIPVHAEEFVRLLVDVHKKTVSHLHEIAQIRAMANVYLKLEESKKMVKGSLQPDDRIRKLLLENRCDLCP